MATILSTPTTVTVATPGTSALSVLAQSMAPGSWAQLAVGGQSAAIGSQGGSSGSLIHFSNSMPWNSFNQSIEILASDHLGSSPGMTHVRYSEAANRFNVVQGAPAVPGIGHGYDHTSVNPHTGDVYHRLYSGFSGSITVYRKQSGGSSFSRLTSVNAQDQVAIGSCWWSGSFTGAGAQGCLMIYNTGNCTGGSNDGQILAYNPLSNSWFYNQQGKSPNYGSSATYHSVMEYSARKNVAVYGGGGDGSRRLWRLNADGTHTNMPGLPSGIQVGVQEGNIVCDPVSGNFLVLSGRQLWELNPSGSGTWTQQTGSRTPPSGVGNPGALDGVISCAIPEYGVIAYVTQTGPSGGTFYLYKHA
jgi:hypothetical protein